MENHMLHNMLNSALKPTLLPTFCAEPKKKSAKSQGLEKPMGVTLSKIKNQQQQESRQKAIYQWATCPFGDQISAEQTGLDTDSVQALQTMTPLEILQVIKKEAKWAYILGKSLTAISGLIFIPCLPMFELTLGSELNGLELFRHPKNSPLNIKKWRFLSASRYVLEQIKMQFIHPKTRSLAFLSAETNPWLNASKRSGTDLVDMWRAHKVMDLLVEKGLLEAVYRPLPLKQGEAQQQLFLGYAITPLGYDVLQSAKNDTSSKK
jgi:hypothetical protein